MKVFLKSVYFKLFSIIFILCLGILVYSNSFHCAFHFDDELSITKNTFIRNIQDLGTIWNFLPRRFILYLSIALNYHFNGLDVVGYHVFNLGVHLITAVLIWWLTLLTLSTPVFQGVALVKKNTSKKFSQEAQSDSIAQHASLIALLVGLLFVSHPLQTESVTYIVQRAASMVTLFYVASLSCYIKSRLLQQNKPGSVSAKFYYMGALTIAVLAMFTKETAITLPLMILLYEFFFFKSKGRFNWRYVSPFLLTLLIIPLTIFFTESASALAQRGVLIEATPEISSWHYLLTQFNVIVTYIRLLIIPLNQNLDYDFAVTKSFFEWPTLISFLFLISILLATKQLFQKYKLLSFSILWFFITLLPESSVLPIRSPIWRRVQQ